MTAVVAQAMALARWWSPGTGYLVLAALTAGGIALEPRSSGTEAESETARP